MINLTARSRFVCAVAVLSIAVGLNAGELPPDQARTLIARLQSEDERVRLAARERMIAANDLSIAPALVELLFFSRHARADAEVILRALFDTDVERKRGSSYQGWFELIGSREDVVPKQGYLELKARQYGRIDPAFARFLDPKHPRTIRPEEIIFGGVPKDGIPALIDPPVISASAADYLRDDEIVFGVEIAGEARAYPQRIMVSHEMANDVVGGKRVSLSYCTLCGSAILYDTTIENRSFTFGSSGLLYRSNKLMYDHQTDTLWSQILGEPVMGPLAGSGLSLGVLPVTLTSWGEWKRLHPSTTVLSLDTGYERNYDGRDYEDYFASDRLMFPVWKRGGSLEPKDQVYVVEADGVRRAYPIDLLRSLPVLHDEINGTAVVIVTVDGPGTVRAYRSGAHRFETSEQDQLRDLDGVHFSVTEGALVSDDLSISLERLPGHQAYWFGLYAQDDEVEVYRSVEDAR